MKHFPIYLNVDDQRITLAGGGETAVAKLRLLLKTDARIVVYADNPVAEIEGWADAGRLTLVRRAMAPGDAICARLHYSAADDATEDARTSAIATAAGALTNIVDNLGDSQFITPAIIDRDPVTVAIGTEGAAPVLARAIKADLEERLPRTLGPLARVGKLFRPLADRLPMGRRRRDFWSEYYFAAGPRAFDEGGETGAEIALDNLLNTHLARSDREPHVTFVGAGPGDPELLTLKARNAIHDADVVIHDRLVPGPILELARREAKIIEAGKQGFGPSMKQQDINDLIAEHATNGAQVVRLKSGDATVFGRLDEEVETCIEANIAYSIVPGITAASAAVAAIGQSMTKRERNSAVRLMTGHDVKGFAEHDWRTLARDGEVAAIYMGKQSARFFQGRLLMHGADPETPVTVVENASRPDQRILHTRLADLEPDLTNAAMTGPALTLYGLAPRAAEVIARTEDLEEALI
jgi:uroporphyrin-III C-methyltransferase/precorrin-2 dehydrogenase/sirohydrochlorin ferrochelatase